MEENTSPRYQSQDALAAEQQRFIGSVYAWLAAGLTTAGTMAYFVSNVEALQNLIFPIFGNPVTMILAWLGLFWLIGRSQDMALELPVGQATAVYFLLSSVFGLWISPVFVFYTSGSITSTFLITAGMFGSMSFIGYTTKKDLSSLGSFLMMGFWGLVIATLVNMFMQQETLGWVITYVGVLVFAGFAATETQAIKEMKTPGGEGSDQETKEAVYGAMLFLVTFINLFLFLMRIFGEEE
jgi:FtsH-binding integral membrane protein